MAYGKSVPKNYINVFEIAKLEGINENTLKSAVGSMGIDGIKSMSKLSPIAHLFKEFEKGTRKSYAVLRRHYEYWKRTGEAPKVSGGRPPKWKSNPDYVNWNFPVPKALDTMFKKVVNTANSMSVTKVSYREMQWLAMKEFCERRPELLYGGDNNGEE